MTNTVEMSQDMYKNEFGEVRIADEVVAIIAGLAATEVDGVISMANDITNAVVAKLGMSNLSHGVKVDIQENDVKVKLSLVLKSSVQAISVCAKVQEKVKSAIESMTGLHVVEVDVKVDGIV